MLISSLFTLIFGPCFRVTSAIIMTPSITLIQLTRRCFVDHYVPPEYLNHLFITATLFEI